MPVALTPCEKVVDIMTNKDLDMLSALFPKRQTDEYDLQREKDKSDEAERIAKMKKMMSDPNSDYYCEDYVYYGRK